jgi:hypothetical protein
MNMHETPVNTGDNRHFIKSRNCHKNAQFRSFGVAICCTDFAMCGRKGFSPASISNAPWRSLCAIGAACGGFARGMRKRTDQIAFFSGLRVSAPCPGRGEMAGGVNRINPVLTEAAFWENRPVLRVSNYVLFFH